MSALKAELIRLIAEEGPLPVSRFMALCLGHPRYGYYMTRDPFGGQGDFTTAPEISQMFGEMIGLWAAHLWQAMGSPSRFALIEIGPGRGTLMADMLRATRIVPGFHAAAAVHLVETSPVLREIQAATLAGKAEPVWHERVETALEGTAIIVANELLDALPIDQFVMTQQGWHERMVGLDEEGRLAFGLAATASDGAGPATAPPGAVLEQPLAAMSLVSGVASHLARHGGGALLIDYGSLQSGFGDTLQAMHRHAFVDPLDEPGEADVTVHVDFARMAQAALRASAATHGPVRQADFLLALGLAERAQALSRKATPEQAASINSAFDRLTERGVTGMGDLFKVLAVSHPGLPPLPGFDLHRLPEQG
ncbi:class I SAM-dependent methyltransferase [Bosea sp. (in: a-proteobacteria)]|uniref:class I SAM-dependent methyltransferase n=1 Tax=Bosea sp. (in: a-proteobacteria) TaxID=1871050 RepID=UPI002732EBBA|nr:class I SAM-dependent methyltransferase [Bosea sp. (in: a-proteobacteria)]MDP3406892.1 class I SAM-dependent methyltransferase [Bosea sp. (in: a-proteobacteria)]